MLCSVYSGGQETANPACCPTYFHVSPASWTLSLDEVLTTYSPVLSCIEQRTELKVLQDE